MNPSTALPNANSDPLFGKRPAAATHWACRKLHGDEWLWQRHPAPGGVELAEWPLAELSVQSLRDRWGAGTYRVMWLAYKNERRVAMGHGRIITLTPQETDDREADVRREREGADEAPPKPPARAPAAAASRPAPLPEPVNAVVELWNVAQRHAQALAEQYRIDADRTIQRERVFWEGQLKQQQQFWSELDRLRESYAAKAVNTGESAVVEELRKLSANLDGFQAAGNRDEPPETDPAEPMSLLDSVLIELAPQCASGLNSLLQAAAAYVTQQPAPPPAPAARPPLPRVAPSGSPGEPSDGRSENPSVR